MRIEHALTYSIDGDVILRLEFPESAYFAAGDSITIILLPEVSVVDYTQFPTNAERERRNRANQMQAYSPIPSGGGSTQPETLGDFARRLGASAGTRISRFPSAQGEGFADIYDSPNVVGYGDRSSGVGRYMVSRFSERVRDTLRSAIQWGQTLDFPGHHRNAQREVRLEGIEENPYQSLAEHGSRHNDHGVLPWAGEARSQGQL